VASFADYFVLANGQTVRQIQAMLNHLEDELRTAGTRPQGREGKPESGWVLLDYGDVIVHVFAAEERQFYDLEGLWHTATPVVRIQ
jgi:ribosome-associated protein